MGEVTEQVRDSYPDAARVLDVLTVLDPRGASPALLRRATGLGRALNPALQAIVDAGMVGRTGRGELAMYQAPYGAVAGTRTRPARRWRRPSPDHWPTARRLPA
jgi:hypothetical protein